MPIGTAPLLRSFAGGAGKYTLGWRNSVGQTHCRFCQHSPCYRFPREVKSTQGTASSSGGRQLQPLQWEIHRQPMQQNSISRRVWLGLLGLRWVSACSHATSLGAAPWCMLLPHHTRASRGEQQWKDCLPCPKGESLVGCRTPTAGTYARCDQLCWLYLKYCQQTPDLTFW